MSNTYSNYVIAGADALCCLLTNYLNRHNQDELFNEDILKNVMNNTINRFLYSFGTGLSYKTQKISKNYNDKIVRSVNYIKDSKFMKDGILYMDSGGFQVAMGALKPESMPEFIELYSQFLSEHCDKYQKAFTLDLPPGPSSSVFATYKDLEEGNRFSYKKLGSLSQPVKDKLLYIHHFRTPSIHDIWGKFLWDEDLADGYSNFATGGIVASMGTDLTIPVIIYTIPLSEIVKYAVQKNIKSFDFHVLGGANYIDIFHHKLFSHHIKKVHNIDCTITYDSSSIFKGLAMGRFIPVFKDDGSLHKLDLRSSALHMKFDGIKTNEDKTYEILNNLAVRFGMKCLNPTDHSIYDTERNTFRRGVDVYLMMAMMALYKDLETYCENYVAQIYPLYQDGKIEEFDSACKEIASKFNKGSITKKTTIKSASIYKSLNVLTQLDMEYNKTLINKFMANDDISSMVGSGLHTF